MADCIKIVNGTIIDGTGAPGYKKDLLIKDGIIERIGSSIGLDEGTGIEIDATGLHVTPGFIDLHAHSGLNILGNEFSPEKLLQGVTTDLIGNCGIGLAPSNAELMAYLNQMAKDLLGGREMPPFPSLKQFQDTIKKKGHSINLAFLVPQGNIRALVMGFDSSKPTVDQMDEMRAILDDNMSAGAFGMSTGLIYPPGSNSTTGELIELAKVVKVHGGFYSSHIRSEGASVVRAIKEAIRIGRVAGIPVQISHVKVGYFSRKTRGIIKTINDAREAGIDVMADHYPYIAGCTSFGSVVLPAWVFEGGLEKFKERLADPGTRNRIIKDAIRNLVDMANIPAAFGRIIPRWVFKILLKKLSKGFLVTYVKHHHELEGKSMKEILDGKYGTEGDVFDRLLNFLADEEGSATTCMFMIDEEKTLVPLMKQPWTCVCTDAYQGHPRTYGTYPRVISKYVREKHILTLEQAIHKMTALPATRLGLHDRGTIKEGYRADIVTFDYNRIQDNATYEKWNAPPDGIHHVIVNGKITVREGMHLKVKAGEILSSMKN
ncbi:MAG: N-acyl-D-amino-acid deacylase family protein [Promethearchaeota archaeon]